MPRHSAPSHGGVRTDQEGQWFANEGAIAVLLSAVGLHRRRDGTESAALRRGPVTIALVICVICAVAASAVLLGGPPLHTPPCQRRSLPVSATNTFGIAGDTKTLFIDLDGTSYKWSEVAPTYQAVILNDWDASQSR